MKSFLPFLRPYIKETAAAPLFKMTEALFELFVPLVIADLIDVGIASSDRAFVIKKCLILALLAFLGLVFSVSAQYFSAKAAVGFAFSVRQEAFEKIMRLSCADYDKAGISTLITRLTSDIDVMRGGVNLTLRLLLRSPFVVFGAMIMAFRVDKTCAVTFAVTVPLLAAVVFGIILSTAPLYKKVREKLDKVTLGGRRALFGIRVIRAFGRENEFSRDFNRSTGDLYGVSLRAESISGLLSPVTYVIINIATAALIYSGALRVSHGLLSQGSVVALYNYMGQILVELIKLANLIITITKAVAGGKRVAAVLALKPTQTFPEDGEAPDFSAPALELKNVSFTYAGAAGETLTDISLTLNGGETLGITGATGSGKTALINLLTRQYDADKGEIMLFGRKIGNYSEKTLGRLFALVPQTPVLFSGTISENLTLGGGNFSEEEIHSALEISQSLDFVERKKDGVNAIIREGGAGLSGGQKQRLTVARALMKKAPLLILDDASSALDTGTDKKMRRAIKNLPYAPAVITVSQRISAVRDCDRILVLDDGAPAGLGTHDELIKNCPVYRDICLSQGQITEGGTAQ